MGTFKDILNELITSARDRVKNPVISACFISIALWNWRSILKLFFSKREIEEVLNDIEPGNIYSIIIPIILASLYLVIVPHITSWINSTIAEPLKSERDRLFTRKNELLAHKIILTEQEVKIEVARSEYRDRLNLNNKINELELKILTSEERNTELSNNLSAKEETIIRLERDKFMLQETIHAKEGEIFNLNQEKNLEAMESQQFESSYQEVSDNVLRSFIMDLPHINSLEGREKTSQYNALGLIKSERNKIVGGSRFNLTRKGLYFILKIYESGLA